jgi:hypothetical protein
MREKSMQGDCIFLINLVGQKKISDMANCNFDIPFPPSSESYLADAETAIVGHKGTFTGDNKSGSFVIPVGIGDIHGDYSIANEILHIHITKKPLLVTCHMIEARLKGYLKPPGE